MRIWGKVTAGVVFSVVVTLLAMQGVASVSGSDVPLVWWMFGAACPAFISATVCVVLARQAYRNQVLSLQLRLALEELQRYAQLDQMTGLLNRSAFLYNTMISTGQSWILLIDLDRFKAINDDYGHHTGDLVISEVARVIRSCTRASDRCGRLGGEEFGVILHEADHTTARRMAERLREDISRIRLTTDCGAQISLTASVGLAPHDTLQPVGTTLRHADEAMYRAKRNGRNQVALA